MKRLSILLALTACAWNTVGDYCQAGPPWNLVSSKLGRKKLDSADLQLTEEKGPWLIYVASFAGPGANQEAESLAIELRRRYKLSSYVHSKHFDFTESVAGKGMSADRSQKRMKYSRDAEFDEYAVMVGDFDSVDDPNLQKTLSLIKFSQPESLSNLDQKSTLRFAGLRNLHKRISGDDEKKKKGPLGKAFATPNPLVPRESYAPQGLDSFVVKMNKGVEHSLLECPRKYSVQVATFRGSVVTNQQMVQEIENGGDLKSRLEEAAVKAHKLTTELRKRKVEAYEFHDRHESLVCVGSFDWVGQQRSDGKQEMNPAVLRVLQQFGASNTSPTGTPSTVARPKQVMGISFDVQPLPIEVPRASLAKDYSRS